MSSEFKFTVTVRTERQSGKFAGKDEIREELRQWLENANESEISGIGADGDSIYDIEDWEVEDAE